MILRTAFLTLGVLVALAGAVLVLLGFADGGVQMLVIGALAAIATAFERRHYRKKLPPAGQWEPTGERFEDPATSEPMEVLYDPVSGERRYEPLRRVEPTKR